MTYKRYIRKNGKLYGPYEYSSSKKDGKVISKYLGRGKEDKSKSFLKIFSTFLLLGILLLAVFFLLNDNHITGRVGLDISNKYVEGENIKGSVKLNLEAGELLPADTLVIINNTGDSSEYLLGDLVEEEFVSGDFFVNTNANISGEGFGYGVAGEKVVYPSVQFKMDILDEVVDESTENETSEFDEEQEEDVEEQEVEESEDVEEEDVGEQEVEESEDVEEEDVEEQEVEESEDVEEEDVGEQEVEESEDVEEEDVEEQEVEESEDVVEEAEEGEEQEEVEEEVGEQEVEEEVEGFNEEGTIEEQEEDVEEQEVEEPKSSPITGEAIGAEVDYVVANVSKNNPFEYNLDEGKTAKIVSSEQDVDLKIKDNVAKVTTDYEEVLEGFGKDYSGNKGMNLEIDLDDLNLSAREGDFVVSLVYGDVEIVSSNRNIEVENINESLVEENVSVEENETIQYGAIVGKPVKWKKRVKVDKIAKVKLPKDAKNITVYKVNGNSSQEETIEEETSFITGRVSLDVNREQIGLKKKNVKVSIYRQEKERGFFRNIGSKITGRTVGVDEQEENVEVSIESENVTEVEIEYETPGPKAFEKNMSYGKEVVISSDYHYKNVLAFTELPKAVLRDDIRLYHVVDGNKERVNFVAYNSYGEVIETGDFSDEAVKNEIESILKSVNVKGNKSVLYSENKSSNITYSAKEYLQAKQKYLDNNLIVYLEWVVPHLSNQTYEIIIEATGAEHIDSNRTFVSDIYEEIKEKDGVYSEEIPENNYVRVAFETPLRSFNDITVYAKSENVSSIEIYEENGTEVLASIENISSEGWYKTYLDGLGDESTLTFDMKILGSSMFFDYIVDPMQVNVSTDVELNNITTENNFAHLSVLDPNLMLYMPFDYPMENASWVDGNYSKALEFDGVDDYVEIADDTSLRINDSFTISSWVYAESFPNAGNTIISKRDDNSLYYHFRASSSGEILFFLHDGSTLNALTFGYTLPTSQWKHLTLIRNGTNISLYVDGSYEGSVESSLDISGNDDKTFIGTYSYGNHVWNGSIDEVRIFNQALNSSEISELYNNNNVLNRSALVGEWTLNDNTGFNAKDTSGESNHGEILNQRTGTEYDFTNQSNDGTAEGGASYTGAGYLGGAYEFDGVDDYVEVGDIGVDENWTISFWLYNKDTIGNDDIYYPIRVTGQNGYFIEHDSSSDVSGFYVLASGDWVQGSNLNENQWYYITIMKNGTNYSLYENGGFVNTKTLAEVDIDDLEIGRRGDFGQLNGTLDEVMIFNRSLSDYEIGQIYNTTYEKFYSSGVQTFRQQNITAGQNVINWSIDDDQQYNGSNLRTRTGYWDTSKGWNVTDMVGFWNFDFTSSTGVYDNSSNSNFGTFEGTAFGEDNLTIGEFGDALEFDGVNDYVALGDDSSLFPNSISMSVWIKPLNVGGGIQGIVSNKKSGVGTDGINIALKANGDITTLVGNGTDNQYVDSGITPDNNAWYHVVATHNSLTNITKIYVNGDYKNEEEFALAYHATPNTKISRFYVDVDNFYFNGSIDEVMIFDKALTSEQIEDIYYKGRASWDYSTWNDYTNGVSNAIDSTTTNILPEIKYESNNYNFYSPIVAGNITINEFYSDATSPSLDINSPLNQTYSTDKIWFNVTASDSSGIDTCWYNLDGGSNITLTNSSGNWNDYNSSMAEGQHTAYFYCNDSANNLNNTELVTFRVDTIKPIIVWENPTPTDGSSTSNDYVTLNTTITDDSETSAWFDWNRSLVGYWTMGDYYNTTGIYDNSSYSHFAEFKGTGFDSSSITTGKRGSALEFDGDDDYVSIADDDIFTFNNGTDDTPFSISAWVYMEDSYQFDIVSKGDWNNNHEYSFQTAYGNLIFSLIEDSSNYLGRIYNGGMAGYENTWIHVVGTYDGSETLNGLDLYIDGVEVDNANYEGGSYSGMQNLNADVEIGGYSGRNPNGSIDEVMIFNRSLSEEEIKALYDNSVNRLYNGFSGLSSGTYDYSAYAIDSSGNLNITDERNVTINSVPKIVLNYPPNGSTGISTSPTLNVTVSNLDGDVMNVSFYEVIDSYKTSEEWTMFQSNLNNTGHTSNIAPNNLTEKVNSYTTGNDVTSSPAVANGYVYGGSNDNKLYQLDASNVSNLIAIYTTGGDVTSSPAVANGYVYVGSNDNKLYQLNASNVSQLIASYGTGSSIRSSPAVANGYVYVGSNDNKLYQLNASNVSQKIASYTTGNDISSSPAVANGYVYVASWDNKLYQLNASDVSQLIASYTANYFVLSSPAVSNGYVYVGSLDNKLYQLNASDVSQLIASYEIGDGIYSSPAVANGYVYVGSWNNKLYQLNASDVSQLIASYTTGNDIYSSPAVANGYVYVGSYDNKLYQLNASNVSQLIASYGTGSSIRSSPAVANGYVYVGSNDNKLYQLGGGKIIPTLLNTSTNVADGSIVTYKWAGLNTNTTYEWFVNVTDGSLTTTSDTWNFTTAWINTTYPENGEYYYHIISSVNYTSSISNPSKCWYSNGTENTSLYDYGDTLEGINSTQDWNNWTIYCNDTSGAIYSTNFDFWVDSVHPSLDINSPLNQTYSTDKIWFNVTASDSSGIDTCWYNLDGGSNITLTNSSGNWNDYNSSMTDGQHTAQFYCNDSNNNLNNTESVTFRVDTIKPIIVWENPTPTDGSSTGNDYVTLNTTITDDSETSAWFDWNRSLVGYWTMGDYYNATGIFDNSSYSHFAEFKGTNFGTSNITSGKRGSALEFDGDDDYVSIADDESLDLTNSFSVSAWVKANDVLGPPQGIVTKGSYSLKEYDDDYIFEVSGNGSSWSKSGDVGSNPYGLAVYDGKLYVANYGSDDVYVYDGSSWSKSGDVGDGPSGLAVYDGKLYVANYGSDDVYVYDGTSWSKSGDVGSGPLGLAVYDGKLYVANSDSNDVYVFNGTSWNKSGDVGNGPYGLAVYDGKLYVANYISDDVYVFNGTSWSTTGSVGDNPNGMAVYEGKLYVANSDSDDVYVYDGSSWSKSGNVGVYPVGLSVYDGKLYVSNYGSDDVYVFNGSSWTKSGDVGTNPIGLAVYDGKLYVANSDSDDVYVYSTGESIWASKGGGFEHVTGVVNESEIKLYVNGVEQSSTSHSLEFDNNNYPLLIGKGFGSSQSGFSGGNSEVFNGSIDEVMIFNRSLSEEEIKALYDNSVNRLYNGFSGLSSGTYDYSAYAIDSSGNLEITSDRQVIVDLTSPSLDINSPLNQTYSTDKIWFNVTASDSSGIDTCWYNLDGGSNITLTNSSGNWNDYNSSMAEGQHTAYFYCNDSANNLNNTELVTFTIDTIPPQLDITYPMNTSYNVNVSQLNYTITDANPAYCWYSRDKGITNSSLVTPPTNFTNVTSIEGSNNWTLYCNDTAGNENNTDVFFFKDTIAPQVTFNVPMDGQTFTSGTINFDIQTDENSSCNYSLNAGATNYSMTSNATGTGHTATRVLTNANYVMNVYCLDNFGNQNNTENASFVVAIPSTSSVTPPSGGGGGGGAAVFKPVVGFYVKPSPYTKRLILNEVTYDSLFIENKGDLEETYNIKLSGEIEDLIELQENVTISPGAKGEVEFKISAPRETGIYAGKFIINSGSERKEVLVTLEVKSERSLFDITFSVPKSMKVIFPGSDFELTINLLQMGLKEKMDVTLNYEIKDFDGNIHLLESETIAVYDQKSFKKEFFTSGFPEGDYVLGTELIYPDGVAVASSHFKIKESKLFERNSLLIFMILIILLVIFLGIFFAIKRYKKLKRHKGK